MSRIERYLGEHRHLVWPLIAVLAALVAWLLGRYLTHDGSPWFVAVAVIFVSAWTWDDYRRRKANR